MKYQIKINKDPYGVDEYYSGSILVDSLLYEYTITKYSNGGEFLSWDKLPDKPENELNDLVSQILSTFNHE